MSAMPGMSAKSRLIIAASSTHDRRRRRSFSREQRSRGADRRGASLSFGTTPPDDDDVFDDDASPFDHRVSCLNVDDYRRRARGVLPRHLYEYLASGSDDERTLRENRAAFARWFLRPRMLRPVGRTSARATLLGRLPVADPILCSPAGVHALCDAGELSTVRAFRDAGVLFGLSQHATRTIEDVAVAVAAADVDGGSGSPPPPPLFYQAYLLKNRAVTRRLIRRALRAGYVGVFLTVDSVRFGYREADARNGFSSLPPPHRLVNYDDDEETAKHAKDDDDDADAPAWDQNTE